ncbi:hypothetical protein K3H40_10360 [Aeromonas veronii]|uniref:hypothetical protein n=1 Tax=Aeromonas veronii TaxID=654 RepID=UPI001F1E3908|nr:hypothetical protein [Aeromonas veronii]MCF5879477.1 hypothetical protein [Aeromonas veronii]
MFELNNYPTFPLFLVIFIIFISLFFLFRRKISSLIDPLCYHILWSSTLLGFLFVFSIVKSSYLISFYFFCTLLFHFFIVYFLLPNVNRGGKESRYNPLIISLVSKPGRVFNLWFFLLLLIFISKWSAIDYFIESPSFSDWFLYRYMDLSGRDPIERILGTACPVFFSFYSFVLIFLLKKNRCFVWFFYIVILCINILAGGRSSLIHFALSLGLFVYYFSDSFSASFKKKINLIGGGLAVFSIVLAISVSSFLVSGVDPYYIILNRIVANADGLEYYIKYDAFEKIPSGFMTYIYSTFGIFLTPLIGPIKNYGWQLSELATGMQYDFAQGANFTLPLQVMALPTIVGGVYTFFISILLVLCRCSRFVSFKFAPFSYYLSASCFTIITDVEYWVFVIASGVIVYFLIFVANAILSLRIKG